MIPVLLLLITANSNHESKFSKKSFQFFWPFSVTSLFIFQFHYYVVIHAYMGISSPSWNQMVPPWFVITNNQTKHPPKCRLNKWVLIFMSIPQLHSSMPSTLCWYLQPHPTLEVATLSATLIATLLVASMQSSQYRVKIVLPTFMTILCQLMNLFFIYIV